MPSRVLVALRVAAPADRAFRVFTEEIGLWWQPNILFRFADDGPGRLALEPAPGGRFTETLADGRVFEIGRITAWEPPQRLAFTWRPESFTPEQSTHVEVRFEPVGEETRVTVEHVGWDVIPQEHTARHRFPLGVFLQRNAEWWRDLLASYGERAAAPDR